MTRQISTKQPNQVVAQPATVAACQQDRGTQQDRADRAEQAVEQQESMQFNGHASAEAARGWR